MLTPANGAAVDVERLAAGEGNDDDRVKVETFAEHPEEVAGDEVLRDNVDRLTPDLQQTETSWKQVYERCNKVFYRKITLYGIAIYIYIKIGIVPRGFICKIY